MKNKELKISVIGLGYIGLPTAALIASKKVQVYGMDINKHAVETINKGKIHIVEPDLEGLVKYDVENEYLKASTEVQESDVFVIAVPTPFKKTSHISHLTSHFNDIPEPDISFVECAISSIIPVLKDGNLVIIESTSPVGTTEKMYRLIQHFFNEKLKINNEELKNNGKKTKQRNSQIEINASHISHLTSHDAPKVHMAYCPERVLPGQVIYELEHNDRVIGGIDEKSTEKACEFYSLFVRGELHKTNARTAEMCKLTENAYRDVNIAFANELSFICDENKIDVYELIKYTNKHPRVNILTPGCGVGGHCIAVDPWFIVSQNKEEAKLIHRARKINDYKPEFVLNKIREAVKKWKEERETEPTIACLGLTFKPDIDDLRESPALYITKKLIEEKYDILPIEPNIKSHSDFTIYDYEYAINKADIIVVLVNHREFKISNFLNCNKIMLDFVGL